MKKRIKLNGLSECEGMTFVSYREIHGHCHLMHFVNESGTPLYVVVAGSGDDNEDFIDCNAFLEIDKHLNSEHLKYCFEIGLLTGEELDAINAEAALMRDHAEMVGRQQRRSLYEQLKREFEPS